MENAETPKKRRRIGWHRWLIIVLVIINAIAVCSYSPILPHIQVPPEPITLLFGDFYLTNTLVATMIADVLLILAAFFTWRATRRGESILTGIAGIMELLVEGLYNMVESTAGKHARRIF
ncbi:MAG: hypothetical protein GTO18_17380, partial [Anaerolineales bacterium]|nr:hypothetical protein [Anaerolineales bacterium]